MTRDLALIAAFFVAACLLASSVAMLNEAWGRPDVWPCIGCAFAFWPIAFSGRPLAAFVVLLAGVLATSYLGNMRDRQRRNRVPDRDIN